MREHQYFVYILTNWNNKVMYVGMTNNLVRRLFEHRTHAIKGFTEKYNVYKLVYFEETADVHAAIAREKEIKKWRREKKNALVIQANPEWRDLGHDLGLQDGPYRQFDSNVRFLPSSLASIGTWVEMTSEADRHSKSCR